MANCTKYHVIELFLKPKTALELEDWLNEREEVGDEFVGVYEGKFIFKSILLGRSFKASTVSATPFVNSAAYV